MTLGSFEGHQLPGLFTQIAPFFLEHYFFKRGNSSTSPNHVQQSVPVPMDVPVPTEPRVILPSDSPMVVDEESCKSY
uniref:Ovule protein n=1 Tax=Strongyloides venezuelensis TaxID=75913 RepID=A0A0K0EUX4_STRVS